MLLFNIFSTKNLGIGFNRDIEIYPWILRVHKESLKSFFLAEVVLVSNDL